MSKIEPSILDYLGKYQGGIMVSVGLMYESKFYDAVFYYTSDQMIINVDEKLEDDLGMNIELHDDYLPLMKKLIELVDPFESVIDQLKEYEFPNHI